ncbi:MAG: transglutaminase family protein [Verrucomicrobiota bacterium]
MKFHVSSELEYHLYGPSTLLFALQCRNSNGRDVMLEHLYSEPCVPIESLVMGDSLNRFSRISLLDSGTFKLGYSADICVRSRRVPIASMQRDSPGRFPPPVLQFLLPSRYCQSDRLRHEALSLFGHLESPYHIALQIRDWILANIAYVSGSSGENCSAMETLQCRQGVCRDFAHLGIAFCRAMSVPARYVSCYAYNLNPPDFHAYFEAFIDGNWYVFDGTGLAPLNGLIRIAVGRDAADAAVCTLFGTPELTSSLVQVRCLETDFHPLTLEMLRDANEGLALL